MSPSSTFAVCALFVFTSCLGDGSEVDEVIDDRGSSGPSLNIAAGGGATYYVATTGDDARDCATAQNIATPRRTIRGGARCLASGDRLEIRGGTYAEPGIDTGSQPRGIIPSGTSWSRPTRIGGYRSENVIWAMTQRAGIRLNNNDQYIVIENVVLDGTAFRQIQSQWSISGLTFGPGAHHIRVKDVEVRYFTGGGGSSAAGSGIMASNLAHHLELVGLNVHHNGDFFSATPPTSYSGHGIYFSADDSLVEGCRIHDNTSLGIQFYSGYPNAGAGEDRVSRNTFRNNRVYDNGKGDQGTGVAIDGDDNLVYNNVIFGNPSSGVTVGYSPGSRRTKIFNNTLYRNAGPAISVGNSSTATDDTFVRNNIMFQNGIDGVKAVGAAGTIVQSHNLTADPKFVNPASGDFRLQPSSPAINAALTLAELDTDAEGKARRPGTWDIGAHEFESTLAALKSPTPLIIDGTLSEAAWSKAQGVSFANPARSDNAVVVLSLWDDTSLYFAYDVTDAHVEAGSGPLYQDDGAEIYLDTANDRSTTLDANDYQIIANVNAIASRPGVTCRKQPRAGGYTLELQIPWSVIATAPSAGKTVGLLLASNDRDLGTPKQFDWLNLIATGSYSRPRLWGSLALSATLASPPDTTPPTVTIQSPLSRANVSGTVTVSGTAADNAALAKVEVQVDGAAFARATGLASWTLVVNAASLSAGSHTLTARATDTSGNTAAVTVDVVVTESPSRRTFYVSTSGSDTANPGTLVRPFRTLSKGLSAMRAGDALFIRGGRYAERISTENQMIPAGTGWADAPLIAGYPTETVVLQPSSGDAVIFLAGPSVRYLKFENLVLDGTGLTANTWSDAGIKLHSPVHHVRFKSIEIRNVGLSAANAGGFGVIGNASDLEFSGLTVHDNGLNDFHHGFYLYGNNVLIESSDIYRNAGWGIHKYPGGDGHIYRNNRIHDNARVGPRGAGIGLYGGSGALVYNNVIWGNATGISANYGASGARLLNNTLYDNRVAGIDLGAGATGMVLTNNILHANPVAIRNAGTVASASSNLCTAPGYGCSSAGDPRFAGAAAGDFHLQAGSPALDSGLTLTEFTTDFDGRARPSGQWDLGAYER